MTAGGVAMNLSLHMFKWTSSTTSKNSYKKGEMKSGDTNWWELGRYLRNYSAIAIMGTAFVTQLLAIFGIAVPINDLVWYWGVGWALFVLQNLGTICNLLAYDQAHRYLNGGSTDASVLSNASTVFGGALADFIESQGDFVLVNMALWTNAEDWALS